LNYKKHTCNNCSNEKSILKARKSIEEYAEEIAQFDGKVVLDQVYINNKTKMRHICTGCGEEFEARPDAVKHNKQIHCERCSYTIDRSGENSSNWNPNLTQEDRENNRTTEKDVQWKKKVMKRDNYECVISGDKNFEIHHIFSHANFKNLRYVEENGITISKKIHKIYHVEFCGGTIKSDNVTLENFILFLEWYSKKYASKNESKNIKKVIKKLENKRLFLENKLKSEQLVFAL